MRRSFRAGAVAMIATAALLTAGCSAGSGTGSAEQNTDPNQKVELTYWAWAPNLDKVVDLWNEKNPNIHVTVNKQDGGDPAITKLLTAVNAGTGAPDLIQAEYQKIPTLVAADALVDLADTEAKETKDNFPEGVWNSVTLGGDALYAVPQDTGPMAFYYRADIFEEPRPGRAHHLGRVRRGSQNHPRRRSRSLPGDLLLQRRRLVHRHGPAGRCLLVGHRR